MQVAWKTVSISPAAEADPFHAAPRDDVEERERRKAPPQLFDTSLFPFFFISLEFPVGFTDSWNALGWKGP